MPLGTWPKALGENLMQNLISAFPVLCYCVAFVFGFLDIGQPFGNAELARSCNGC